MSTQRKVQFSASIVAGKQLTSSDAITFSWATLCNDSEHFGTDLLMQTGAQGMQSMAAVKVGAAGRRQNQHVHIAGLWLAPDVAAAQNTTHA